MVEFEPVKEGLVGGWAGDVVGVRGADAGEVGAAGEPPAPLAVDVLDLPALPWRVRIAEPGVEPVGRDEVGPTHPFKSLVERDRATQVHRDLLDPVDQAGERSIGVVAVGHRDQQRGP